MIRLGTVEVNDTSKRLVNKALDEGMIGQSPLIEEFEQKFAEKIGSRHAIAVCSGSMADIIALAVMKEIHGRTEVILPALTFAAQLNAVLINGLTPVFYDDIGDVGELITNDTLCVFPVHLLGVRTELDDWGVPIVEDACEAMGTEGCGTTGDVGTFSFFPSHTITTGEGGMIVTNDDRIASIARQLRNHGRRTGQNFRFDLVGFNGKMSAVNAAIGIGMLEDFDDIVKRRKANYKKLGGTLDICPHAFPALYSSREERDAKLEELRENGVEARNLFSCLPTQELAYKFLRKREGQFTHSEYVGDCGLYVPCHQDLTDAEIKKIKSLL